MSSAISFLTAALLGSALLLAAVMSVGAAGPEATPVTSSAVDANSVLQSGYVTVGFLGRRAVRR